MRNEEEAPGPQRHLVSLHPLQGGGQEREQPRISSNRPQDRRLGWKKTFLLFLLPQPHLQTLTPLTLYLRGLTVRKSCSYHKSASFRCHDTNGAKSRGNWREVGIVISKFAESSHEEERRRLLPVSTSNEVKLQLKTFTLNIRELSRIKEDKALLETTQRNGEIFIAGMCKKNVNKHYPKFCCWWLSTGAENRLGDLFEKGYRVWPGFPGRILCFTREDTAEASPFVRGFEIHSSENICLRPEGPFIFPSACSSPLITDAVADDWLRVDTYFLNPWSQMRQTPTLNSKLCHF